MLDMSMPEEVLLRILTLLSNIFSAAKQMKIDPLQLPAEDKAAAPDTMLAFPLIVQTKSSDTWTNGDFYFFFKGTRLFVAYPWSNDTRKKQSF